MRFVECQINRDQTRYQHLQRIQLESFYTFGFVVKYHCNIFEIIRMDWTCPEFLCHIKLVVNRVNRQVLNLLVACGADSRLLRSDFMRGNPISVGDG